MSTPYSNVKKRSERLVKDITVILNKLEELADANKKLRDKIQNIEETSKARDLARERILQSLQPREPIIVPPDEYAEDPYI